MKAERLDATAWADAALEVVSEAGVAAVGVEPLARRLGVTKGSFYWHFKTRDELLLAAAQRWEATGTHEVIERVERIDDPRERLVALFRAAFRHEPGSRIASAFAGLADHAAVGPVVRRVTSQRLTFIARCYRDLGLSTADSRRKAYLAYAAFLGLAELERVGAGLGTSKQRDAHVAAIIETLVPAR
jgi:AcrR family transcriptional regulator